MCSSAQHDVPFGNNAVFVADQERKEGEERKREKEGELKGKKGNEKRKMREKKIGNEIKKKD